MRTPAHDIAIILINYNSSEFTIKCVESVLKKTSTLLSYQIIIVDNASKTGDFETLKSAVLTNNNEKISLHRSRFNTGFGGGNMHGIQFADARYYLFLNNDTLMIGDPIKECYDFMEQKDDASSCGPQIENEHGERQLSFDHFTCFAREVFGKRFIEMVYGKPNRRKQYYDPLSVDYVNGSFMLFKAEDFNAVGGFDTNIFLYFEENDICYRLKKKGRNTYFIPSSTYMHYQGQSVNKTKIPIAIKTELKTSMFYVIRKNLGYAHYQFLRLVFIVRYGITTLLKPRYFKLFHRILIGLPMGKSLKQKQVIED